MVFQAPTLGEAGYRMWRLRRLFVLCTLIPVVALGAVKLVTWVITGAPIGDIWPFAFFVSVLIGTHIVLFPNATSETKTFAIAIGIMVLAAPLAGSSILGWFVLGLFALWVAIFQQVRLTMWNFGSRNSAPVFSAGVRTKADIEDIKTVFALYPGKEIGTHICGPADQQGIFEVRIIGPDMSLHDGLDDEEAAFLAAEQDAYDAEEANDQLRADLIESGMTEAEADIALSDEPQDLPAYWAKVEETTDTSQTTLILSKEENGDFEKYAELETQFLPLKRGGYKVIETERVVAYQVGLGAGMWLTDFQMDSMIQRRDQLEDRPTKALRSAHHHSILTMLGQFFMRRNLRARMSD